MLNQYEKNITTGRWFTGFILAHLAVWTLIPTFLRFNLPLDAMEGATWSQFLAWGYDKNPFMTAWLTHLAISVAGYSGWGIYLVSQLSVVVCFIAVWQIAKHMLAPVDALVAVLLLESMQYYNLHAIDFSDNTLELACWSLIILFFYKAISKQRWHDWLLVGIFAGLAMMTKYYSAILLFSMLLFLFYNKSARISFKNPFLYGGCLFFIAIMTPHMVWLCSHDFITINYALDRSLLKNPTWFKHLFFPIQFATQELEALIPPGLLLLALGWRKSNLNIQKHIAIESFDKQFIFFVGLVPFLLTLFISAVIGLKLRAGWGQPLLSLWGIAFMMWLRPLITPKKFYRFIAALLFLLTIALCVYCANILKPLKPNSANFPGKIIAADVTKRWHDQFHQPLYYVAGERWLAGNIAFYSDDHPFIFIDSNHQINPMIDEDKLRRQGAIFVWDLSRLNRRTNATPEDLTKRFPTLTTPIKLLFFWRHNKKLSPAEIMLAFLPPTQNLG